MKKCHCNWRVNQHRNLSTILLFPLLNVDSVYSGKQDEGNEKKNKKNFLEKAVDIKIPTIYNSLQIFYSQLTFHIVALF